MNKNSFRLWDRQIYFMKPHQTTVARIGHLEAAIENIEITSDRVSFEDNLGAISPLTEVIQGLLDGGGTDLSNYYNKQEVDSKVITTVERNKLSGIATNATANDTDANLKNRANHTGTQPFNTISGTASISQIPTGVTASTVALGNHTHANANTTTAGFMSANDKTKLDGIASNATANDTDANLKNRANHTGTQPFSTISGTATIAQIPTGTTSTTVALGNHTHASADMTNAGFMSSSDKLKLDGIEANATSNDTDANLKNRANHTGTQAFTTLSGTATVAQVPNLPSSKINLMTGYVNTVTGIVQTTDTLNQAISKIENRFKAGQATFELDGVETVFTITHGYSVIPSSFALTFSDGANLDFIQSIRAIDATNITITCGTAPTGADITVYWQAFL